MSYGFKDGLKGVIKEVDGFLYTYGHFLNKEQYSIFDVLKKSISKEFNVK